LEDGRWLLIAGLHMSGWEIAASIVVVGLIVLLVALWITGQGGNRS
jgi:hypothetical protein